jgi:hypothetical protein
MSTPAAPLMYAELLSNIRQVSVIASLPSPATKETSAELSSSDRQHLKLSHNGITVSLTLPARVVAASPLQQPVLGKKEVSWRLPVADQAIPNGISDFSDSAVAPWAASNLSPGTEISCRKCKTILVSRGRIQWWRDLPSENWAEMMDFWHCHKPSVQKKNGDHDHQADSDLLQKGYGANSRFVAQSAMGFVSLTYFLLAEQDCPGVEVRQLHFSKSSSTTSFFLMKRASRR